LSTFGIVSRGLAIGWRRRSAILGPVAAYAMPTVVRTLAVAPAVAERAAAVGAHAGQAAYRRASAGIQALARRPRP
jgi:hypothetical protein